MDKYSFTIITVVKNDQKNIEKTIKSVIINKNKHVEYIVVDGKSKDKTLSILRKYKKHINKLISQKDSGIYDAMNKGIKNSKNDIIVFCNSGDFFYKGAIKKIEKIFNKNDLDYVFGTVLRNYTEKKILKYKLEPKRIFLNFDFATAHSTGFFLKREAYNKLGLYKLKFKCSADYDLYFRMIRKGFKGAVTSKKDKIGNVASGGFSSKISFFEHLIEETKIRLENKQSIIMILLIFFYSLFRRFMKIFFKFFLKI